MLGPLLDLLPYLRRHNQVGVVKRHLRISLALTVKNLPANAGDIRDVGSIPGPERSPGGGHGNALLPGESHGQKSLAGYSPQGHKESDMTEAT